MLGWLLIGAALILWYHVSRWLVRGVVIAVVAKGLTAKGKEFKEQILKGDQ